MIKRVAFIGAGNMGSRMARRVKASGFDVLICDTNAETRATFQKEGLRVTDRAADTASADAIIVLVASDAQLKDVLLGDDGVAAGLTGGHRPVVLVMSTTLPDVVRMLGDELRSRGVTVIDAPVSGGPVGAELGTLSIMTGGADADIARVMPVLTCMGKNVVRCGDVGTGQVVKLVNNMIAIANIYVVSEAYTLAERAGVNLAALAPILEVSTGRNFLSENIERARAQYAAWAADLPTFESISHITRKDMGLVSKLAESNDLSLPALEAIAGILDNASPDVFARWQRLGRIAAP